MLGRIWLPERSGAFLAMLRLWIAATLRQDRYDVIFCEGLIQAACVAPGRPVVLGRAEIESYLHPYLGPERVKRAVNLTQARAQEQRGLDRAARAFYASQWSIDEVARRYRVAAGRLKLAPFAENMMIEATDESVHAAAKRRGVARCDLLFIGVDWARRRAGDGDHRREVHFRVAPFEEMQPPVPAGSGGCARRGAGGAGGGRAVAGRRGRAGASLPRDRAGRCRL